MRRGINFIIPNQYGSLLGEVLKPIDMNAYHWKIGRGESYIVVNNQIEKDLFLEDRAIIEGDELKNLIENENYYIIFADLQAYPKGEFSTIETYEEFIESKCELVLLVVDCSFVTIYCKSKEKIELLYINARNRGFENVEYITDENDGRTRLSVW